MRKLSLYANSILHRASAVTGVGATILAAIFIAGIYAQFSFNSTGTRSSVSAAQDELANQELEAEVITILPTGFQPAEIIRSKGEFLMVINNRTGLEEVNWQLDREVGGNLHKVKMREGKLRSGSFEKLPPGRYRLSELDHPQWLCLITITSN
jgi:hypothetical protein